MDRRDFAGLPSGDSPRGRRVTDADVAQWAAECIAEDRAEELREAVRMTLGLWMVLTACGLLVSGGNA